MNGRRDAAAAPLLTLTPPAPRTTAGRCQLSGPTERRGSLGEGVGRCRRRWNWPPSRSEGEREVGGRRARERKREREKRQRWKREKGGERQRKEETKWLHRYRASPRSCSLLWHSTCFSSALCSPSPRGRCIQEGLPTDGPRPSATETPVK